MNSNFDDELSPGESEARVRDTYAASRLLLKDIPIFNSIRETARYESATFLFFFFF